MVNAHFINDTTPVEVHGENEQTTVNVTSQTESKRVGVYSAGDHANLTGREKDNQHPISAITNLQAVLDSKTDTSDLSNVAFSGSYNDLLNKPFIPSKTSDLENDIGYITDSALTGYATQNWVINQNYITDNYVGNAVLTIQRNNVDIDTFTANAKVDKTINIAVPTTAADVNALPDSTKYGYSIDLSLDTTDYKLTLTLKDQDGTILNSKTVDFPIESVVVNGTYDSINKKIVLTLQNGNTIDIPVGALIAGLQTEITASNKLDADLVTDSTSTNKFVTSSDKTTWNGKQDAISDLSAIRTNATNGASAYTTIQGYGNIVTHNVSEFATSAQGALADSAVQPSDLATVATSGSYNDLINKPTNVSAFTNDAGYITNSALTGYATQNWVGQQGFITGITSSDVTTALGYTPYNSSNPSGYITSAALNGYATESWVGQQGYLTSITSANVIAALGYTPYSAANPNGYITSSALTPYVLSTSLATVATSGSYNDLSNKPTIPAAQVNSDWNAASGVAQILNKPTIPTDTSDLTNGAGYITSSALSGYALSSSLATVATSGSYTDLSNKPTIPTVNNPTITFTQGGTTKGAITLNQSSAQTIAFDAGGGTIDDALSLTSENPVQNKVVTQALTELSANVNMDAYLDMIIAGNTSDLPIIAQSTYSDDLDDIIGGTYDNNV